MYLCWESRRRRLGLLHVFHLDLKATYDLLRLFTQHVSSESLRRRLLVRHGLALQAKHYGASECLLLNRLAAEGDASLTA